MSDSQFLVYLNRFNEVKPYEVEVIAEGTEYLSAYDLREDKGKTLKLSGILSWDSSFEEADSNASFLQGDYEIIPRNKTGKTFANPDKKIEVCFTGFSKSDKAALIEHAKQNDMFVRSSVTTKLGLLVCGENAGWAKLIKATELEVPRVFGIDGFNNFLETGEFAE